MTKDNENNDDKKYNVGYGKPPKNTRFGQIGGNKINRKGAPSKAQRLMKDRFSHELMRGAFLSAGKETVTINDGGKQVKLPKMEALPKMVLNKALKGDMRAFELYMRYTDRYAKEQDNLLLELCDLTAQMKERVFEGGLTPGSKEHYRAMYSYFKFRKAMREEEGGDIWPYLDDEPITRPDWKCFMHYFNTAIQKTNGALAWPPPYPSHKEEHAANQKTEKQHIEEHLEIFQNRKDMRAKEGLEKWPFTVEEPVDDEDWQHFIQHIQDRLEGKANPAPWPPAYWDD